MSESEALAASNTSRRNITIEITNRTREYCLIDPKVYLENGGVHTPPQPTVRPLKTEVCNLTKGGGATGAVGVLTYDLFKRRAPHAYERISMMFSVPFDYNFYKNWMALGIFPTSKECNQSMYKEMYNDDEEGFVRKEASGCGVTWKGKELTLMATMSPVGRSIMKVEVWDNIF